MRPHTLLEIIDAAHLSAYVDGPFKQRGGIMIVGPPGSLKSTFVDLALNEYPSALVLSDLNVNQMIALRDDLISGRYRSIGFLAFEKLYQRHGSTSSNIEGHISALVEEGFTRASFEDQRMATIKARCMVCAAMTYSFYSKKFRDWAEGGFARRFIWVTLRIKDSEKIQEAIHSWELINFDGIPRREPKTRIIPYSLSDRESSFLRLMIKQQPGDATPYVLLKKIAVALKWKYSKDPSKVEDILKDFRPALTKSGAEVEL